MPSQEYYKGQLQDLQRGYEASGDPAQVALDTALLMLITTSDPREESSIRAAYDELHASNNVPPQYTSQGLPRLRLQGRPATPPQEVSWLQVPQDQQMMLLRDAEAARLAYEAALGATDPTLLVGPSWDLFQTTNTSIQEELRQVLAARGRARREAQQRLDTNNSEDEAKDRNLVRTHSDVVRSRQFLLPYLEAMQVNGLRNSGELIPLFALSNLNVYDAWIVVDPDNLEDARHRDRVQAAFDVFVRQLNGEDPGYDGLRRFNEGLAGSEDDVGEAGGAQSQTPREEGTAGHDRDRDPAPAPEDAFEEIEDGHAIDRRRRRNRWRRTHSGNNSDVDPLITNTSSDNQDGQRASRARNSRRPLTALTYGNYDLRPPQYGEEDEFNMADPATTARRERDLRSGRYGIFYDPEVYGPHHDSSQNQGNNQIRGVNESQHHSKPDGQAQGLIDDVSRSRNNKSEHESDPAMRNWQNDQSFATENDHAQNSVNVDRDGWPVYDEQMYNDARPAPDPSRADPYEAEDVPPLSNDTNFVGPGRTLGSSSNAGACNAGAGPSNASSVNAVLTSADPMNAHRLSNAADHEHQSQNRTPPPVLRAHTTQSIEPDNVPERSQWAPSAEEESFNQKLANDKYLKEAKLRTEVERRRQQVAQNRTILADIRTRHGARWAQQKEEEARKRREDPIEDPDVNKLAEQLSATALEQRKCVTTQPRGFGGATTGDAPESLPADNSVASEHEALAELELSEPEQIGRAVVRHGCEGIAGNQGENTQIKIMKLLVTDVMLTKKWREGQMRIAGIERTVR